MNITKTMDEDYKNNLAYFSILVDMEKGRALKLLDPFLPNLDPETGAAIDQMVQIISEYGARVSVLEQAIELQLLGNTSISEVPLLFSEVGAIIERLQSGALHKAEIDDRGRRIRWTCADKIDFLLPVLRNRKKNLGIYFTSIIKPEYIKKIQIEIDDVPVRHAIRRIDRALCIVCKLPRSKNLSLTKISIRLPAVHSPKSLGISADDRELGIALHNIIIQDKGISLFRSLLKI